MATDDNLRVQLDDISTRITGATERLKLRGLFHKDHAVTAEELAKRYKILAQELDGEVANLEAHGLHVGSLEKAVLSWVKSLNFDR